MFPQHARTAFLLAISLTFVAGCSQADNPDLPATLQALEKQGLTVIEEFDVGGEGRGEVRAFAGVAGDQPVAVYLLSGGSAIVGTRVNANGEAVDEPMLLELVAKPMGEQTWARLEAANWVLDGAADAPRVVYTFSDPNCPYCNRFWETARPWIDSGKVQLRHLLVGIIKEDSPTKVAAILDADDPSAALLENERRFAEGGVAPAQTVSAEVQAVLDANQMLMVSQGFRGTPGIIVRDENGLIQKYNGMPQPDALADVLGPR